MRYEDYIVDAPHPCATEEQFVDMCGRIKAENRLHLNKLLVALDGRMKIDAIRALRSLAEFGLKEAKDYVEALMDKEPLTKEPKYCVVRGYIANVTSVGRSLFECNQDAEYILKEYPDDPVRICQIVSESREITTRKMVDL